MRIATVSDKIVNKFSVEFKSHIFNFYYIFCLFAYHLFLIPYKFEFMDNGYKVYTNQYRKVLCSIVHFCILILGIGNLRKSFAVDNIFDKPNHFFVMAEAISLFSYILVFIYMASYKQNAFIDIIETSSKCTKDFKKSKKYQRFAIVMHVVAIFSCFAHLLADTFYGHGSFSNLICTNAGRFYYAFRLRDSEAPLPQSEVTIETTCFTLFLLVVKLWLRLSSHFSELSFYIGAVSVGVVVKDFLNFLSLHQKLSIEKITECYNDMKILIDNVNSICGGFVVAVFAASIPHFARDTIAVFDSNDWWLKLDFMQYAFFYLASLIYVAEAANNIKQFTEYLTDFTRREKCLRDTDKLTIILLEVQSARYPIGLQGYGFFTISYKFLGAVCSIIVTYTIILFQLQ